MKITRLGSQTCFKDLQPWCSSLAANYYLPVDRFADPALPCNKATHSPCSKHFPKCCESSVVYGMNGDLWIRLV